MNPIRALRLVVGLHLRGWLNRLAAGRAARRRGSPGPLPGPRPATLRRRVGTGALMLVVIPFMIAQVGTLSARFLGNAWRHVEQVPDLSPTTWYRLAVAKHEVDPELRAQRIAEVIAADPVVIREPAERRRTLVRHTRFAVERLGPESGLAGFGGGPPGGVGDGTLAPAGAVLAVLLAAFVLASSLGLANQDLGRVEPLQRWLATLPAPAATLALGQLLGHLATSLFLWICLPAYLTVVGVAGGWGWWSLPAALLGTLAVGVMIASARLASESWLRAWLDHDRRKNLQAVCTVLGLGLMILVYSAYLAASLPSWLIAVLGRWWTWLPPAWPVVALLGGGPLWLAAAVLAAGLGAAGATVIAVRAGRGGLEDAVAAPSGRRGRRVGSWAPLPIFTKDLRLLGRDRAFLVAVLVTPLALVGVQLVINQGLIADLRGSFAHACTFAFVLGGYVLLHGAATILSSEGPAAWILMGAPVPLRRILAGKLALWIAIGLAYALVAVVVAVVVTPWPGVAGLGPLALVLAGVPIFAAIAAGLGAAATDPLASDPQRRIAPGSMWFYLAMLGGYAQAMNSAGAHAQLAFVMVAAVLAYGLWQRLDDRLPYLLDPGERPARQLALSDGAIAAMLFLVLQGLLAVLMAAARVETRALVLLSFGGAGVLAALTAIAWLWREGVERLPRALGLVPADGRWGVAALRCVAGGGVAGAVALLGALAWLALVARVPALRSMVPVESAAPAGAAWVVLAVVFAPLCEEFIFRGLLYSGLRRSLPGWIAVVASAAVFALIHPTLAVVPVFGLGCAAALAYRWAGWLPAAIIVHAVYNAGLVVLAH